MWSSCGWISSCCWCVCIDLLLGLEMLFGESGKVRRGETGGGGRYRSEECAGMGVELVLEAYDACLGPRRDRKGKLECAVRYSRPQSWPKHQRRIQHLYMKSI
jgi:hypothetical protein